MSEKKTMEEIDSFRSLFKKRFTVLTGNSCKQKKPGNRPEKKHIRENYYKQFSPEKEKQKTLYRRAPFTLHTDY